MNTTRKPSCRFLSLLTALCLLLTIFPATAECPATPTDLGPVEELLEVPEGAEEQEDAGLKEEPPEAEPEPADPQPLTEEETAAWLAADHAGSPERMGYPLETVAFGTEGEADKNRETEPEATAGAAAGENDGEKADQKTGEAPEEETSEKEPGEEAKEESGEAADAKGAGLKAAAPGETAAAEKTAVAEETAAEETDAAELTAATQTDLGPDNGGDEPGQEGDYSFVTERLPEVRNQGNWGTCWIFAAIGAMEINLLLNEPETKTTDVDLSETYLAYYTIHIPDDTLPLEERTDLIDKMSYVGSGSYLDNGGTNWIAFRILENLIGTVDEADAPYYPYSTVPDPKQVGATTAQLTGAYIIDPSDISLVKEMIRTHGSVDAAVYMPGENNTKYKVPYSDPPGYVGYSSEHNCLYGTYPIANHEILLVGWNDSFPASNFVEGLRPEQAGAWKVRNSWGAKYGEGGYFWVSYYDAALTGNAGTVYSVISSRSSAVADGTETMVDRCYTYSRIPDNEEYQGTSAWVLKKQSPVTITQSYQLLGNEQIVAVGAETGTAGVTMTAAVTVDGTTYTGTLTAAYQGFYRISLDEKPTLGGGDKTVTVSVTYEKTGEEIVVPYEKGDASYPAGGYRYAPKGHGFTVNDDSDSYENDDSCIKIYTKDTAEQMPVSFKLLTSPEKKMTVDHSDLHLGKEVYYSLAQVLPNRRAVKGNIAWTSSDPSILEIVETGWSGTYDGEYCLIRHLKNGTARLTAYLKSDPSVSDYMDITVNLKAAESSQTTQPDPKPDPKPDPVSNPEPKPDPVPNPEPKPDPEPDPEPAPAPNPAPAPAPNPAPAPASNPAPAPAVIPVSSVSLDRADCGLTEGDSIQLTASVSPENATSRTVTWSSSDTGIATVSAGGLVRATHPGKAVITAASGGKTATCTVTVSPKDLIEGFVYRMYRICLLREPDPDGLSYWVGKLRNREATGSEIAQGFYCSQEMVNRRLSNSEFVTRAYEGIMGRSPDAGGLQYWTGLLDSGVSYTYIVSGFTGSTEFADLCAVYGINRGGSVSGEARDQNPGVTAYVSRLYTKMLGRGYDSGGLNYWCGVILERPSKETLLDVALSGFMHSLEFLGKNLDDTEFVKVMYRTFLDRESDAGGLQYWVGELQSGRSRDDIALGFALSEEFGRIMAQFGL